MPTLNRKNVRVLRNVQPSSTMYGRPDMQSGPFTLYRRPADSNDGWEYFVRIERQGKPVRILGPSLPDVAYRRYLKLVQAYGRSFSRQSA